MNIFEDLILVYKKTSKETFNNISKNPVFLLVPIFFGALYQLVVNLFSIYIGPMLGVLAGFLTPIIFSMILSSYFSLCSDLIFYNRLNFSNFTKRFTEYANSVYSVYFILILISWISPILGNSFAMNFLISILLTALFNPIAEEIYIGNQVYTSAYIKSLEFLKENAILWFPPFIIYMLILKLLGFTISTTLLMSNIIDIPLGNFNMSPLMGTNNIKSLLALIITGVYAIFRGNLFGILNNSSRRKRTYMGDL